MAHIQMPGGFKEACELTDDVKEILLSVKSDVEASLGRGKLNIFNALLYTTQVVAGTNYLFKVSIDNDEIIHVKVHKPLPHTNNPPMLMTVDTEKILESPMP